MICTKETRKGGGAAIYVAKRRCAAVAACSAPLCRQMWAPLFSQALGSFCRTNRASDSAKAANRSLCVVRARIICSCRPHWGVGS